ncbi:MAG: sulfatase-like hydrolase/transferase [Bulleidia sp.]
MKTGHSRRKISHSRYAYRNPYVIRKTKKHEAVRKCEENTTIRQTQGKSAGFIARQKEYHRQEIEQRKERIETAVQQKEATLQEVKENRQGVRDLKQQMKEYRRSVRLANRKYRFAKKQEKRAKKKNYGVWTSLFSGLIGLFGIFLMFVVKWLFDTWPKLQMDELVYQITAPLEGTGTGMIDRFIQAAAVPTFVFLVIIIVILVLLANAGKKVRQIGKSILCVVGGICVGISTTVFCTRLDVRGYIENQMNSSDFIEKNYVDPANVELIFPQEKRNLIMIFLESMETTFSDVESGGGFRNDVIPELTKLSQENENFSGDSETLNGGVSMPGTTWTMGGLFAATSGLPLQIDIQANSMDTQKAFFPGIVNLGDILSQNGYNQVFECGSDAVFGGRQLYFQTHGNYEIHDLNYWKRQGVLDSDYYVWWGYEDQKLFEYAKNDLSELASADEPFNYTMLTVDTHFEDGYLCDLCEDEYGDRYADVMACSSRQVTEFISWIQEQDWYENTTIVITGDHPTMDSDFCNDVDPDYQRRVYTAYINAAPVENNSTGMRSFTTFDTFPTTLSALGVKIDGNRLGLGTDLFSGVHTLLEKSDVLSLSTEVAKSSDFMREKAELDQDMESLINRTGTYPTADVQLMYYDSETSQAYFRVKDIFHVYGDKEEVRMICTLPDGTQSSIVMDYEGEGAYTGSLTVPADQVHLVVEADVRKTNGNEVEEKTVTIMDYSGHLYLIAANGNSFEDFLMGVNALDTSRYAVFMNVQTNAVGKISDQAQNLMEHMGILNLANAAKPAAYAVISDGIVHTANSVDYIRDQGILENGVPYVISSSSTSEQTSSIIIGHGYNDYSPHGKGINVVVYDMQDDQIVCAESFDTAGYGPSADIALQKISFFTSDINIKVTNVEGANAVSRILARIYDRTDPDYVKEQYLNLNFDHEYEADITMDGHRRENLMIQIYVEDTDFAYHYVDTAVWENQ